jgi:hypothetical protein
MMLKRPPARRGIAVGLVSWLLAVVAGWDVVAVADARAGRGR